MMNPMQRFLLPAFASMLFAACGGISPDPAGGEGPAGDKVGRLSIALTGTDGLGAGLVAHLRVLPDGSQTPAAERESEVDARGRWSEVVPLEQGLYDVLLDLLDVHGMPVWSGAKSDVSVVPGVLTALDLSLDPAGGIQIVADIAAGGDWFTIVGAQTTNAAARSNVSSLWNVSGFDRVDPATGTRRYFVSRCNSSSGNSLEIFGAPSPATYAQTWAQTIVLEGTVPGTWTNWCTKPYTITSVGDAIYVAYVEVDRVKVLVSPVGFSDWRLAAVLPADRNGHATSTPGQVLYDVLLGCAFLVDDQFNLFCSVKEWREGAKDSDWRIVHAFSPDGTVWSPFLPYLDVDGVRRLDAVGTLRVTSANRNLVRMQAGLLGGVYHLWLLTDKGLGGEEIGRSLVHAVSTNRRDWSAFDEEVGLGPAAALTRTITSDPRSLREMVVFRAAERWEMVYRSNTSYYSHAVSDE